VSKAFKIARWHELYEVDDKGKQAKPDSNLRQSPLDFVRFQVHGRAMGAGYRRLQSVCKTAARFESTFAVWAKLLELAGCESADRRGRILNEHGQPASVEDIAFFTGFRESSVAFAIKALSHPDVGWIEADEEHPKNDDSATLRDSPGNSGEFRECPGKVRNPSRTITKPNPKNNSTELNETECESESERNGNPESDGKDLMASSDSDSGAKPINRAVAWLKYSTAVSPLLGSNGPGNGKYPPGSSQHEGDVTSTGNWFKRRIWPEDDADDDACRKRYHEFMAWLDSARRKEKPLAWLTSLVKKWPERTEAA